MSIPFIVPNSWFYLMHELLPGRKLVVLGCVLEGCPLRRRCSASAHKLFVELLIDLQKTLNLQIYLYLSLSIEWTLDCKLERQLMTLGL